MPHGSVVDRHEDSTRIPFGFHQDSERLARGRAPQPPTKPQPHAGTGVSPHPSTDCSGLAVCSRASLDGWSLRDSGRWSTMSLRLVPVSFADACEFVAMWHRHHQPPNGHRFSVGVADGEKLVGVCIVSHPVARHLMDGLTLEVIRSATDGTPHVNSMLYAAAWRAAKALGYGRLVTYTQAGESGSSLRAAGWRVLAERPARSGWNAPSRPRDESSYVSVQRTLWEVS